MGEIPRAHHALGNRSIHPTLGLGYHYLAMAQNKKEKIAIVGGSAAGIYLAIFLMKKHPDFEVTILEKNDKLGKKLLATGNGHCNLLNKGMCADAYNDPEFMAKAIKEYPPARLLDELESLGVRTLEMGDLVYPLSYSASAYLRFLIGLLASLNVKVSLGVRVDSYEAKEKVVLHTGEGRLTYDRVYFAVGGKSQPNLGSDGSLFDEFKRHGYEVAPLRPALCPIKTKEPTKSISGLRHKAYVLLRENGKEIHGEKGEILFKDDGLSGIAVFNCQSYIARMKEQGKYEIDVDLFPEMPADSLCEDMVLSAKENPAFYLDAYLEKPLKEYCLKRAGFAGKTPQNRCEIAKLVAILKDLRFEFDASYPFSASQVTTGGVSIKEIDENMLSRKEAGVGFVGECLDIDDLCGGYNLGWALLSALLAAR